MKKNTNNTVRIDELQNGAEISHDTDTTERKTDEYTTNASPIGLIRLRESFF